MKLKLDGWQHETQILTWVLSYDKVHSPEALSICSASAAMCISEVSEQRQIEVKDMGEDEKSRRMSIVERRGVEGYRRRIQNR